MTQRQFINGIRILFSIDAFELGDPSWYPKFRDSPAEFLVRSDDERAELIWRVIEKRSLVR